MCKQFHDFNSPNLTPDLYNKNERDGFADVLKI